MKRRTPHNPLHPRNRQGSAVLLIVLLVLAVTGLGLLTMQQGQQQVTYGMVATDSQRALDVADACAAGAIKTLPFMLDYYLSQASATGVFPPIVNQQFDANFFGYSPFGAAPRAATCVVTIEEVADDAPAPGYSEGGGCFKRVTLRAVATLFSVTPGSLESIDIEQRQNATVRQVVVRGLFGPVSCN
ncbi:MAG: hypothetical protein JW797_15530 [Bradymonadales bacterium]|nr:hypothetical protein [Bradymonadales bacterium]